MSNQLLKKNVRKFSGRFFYSYDKNAPKFSPQGVVIYFNSSVFRNGRILLSGKNGVAISSDSPFHQIFLGKYIFNFSAFYCTLRYKSQNCFFANISNWVLLPCSLSGCSHGICAVNLQRVWLLYLFLQPTLFFGAPGNRFANPTAYLGAEAVCIKHTFHRIHLLSASFPLECYLLGSTIY